MPTLWIDDKPVEVPAGTTVLEAARRLGIAIPTLCHLDGCEASASCMVCVVALAGSGRLVPSCAMPVQEGLRVESQTPAVLSARRAALELLLGDHVGDCVGPCQLACPQGLDVPAMLRAIAANDWSTAVRISSAASPGDCRSACEKACRRGRVDAAVAICRLHQLVADMDTASPGAKRSAGLEAGSSPARAFSHRLGKASAEELEQLLAQAGISAAGRTPQGTLDVASAPAEAARCLQCDCRKNHHCRLRDAAQQAGLTASRRVGTSPPLRIDASHPHLVFEAGKCIRCGLCVQIARREGEGLGLAFSGRGFDVRVAVPLEGSLAQGLNSAWRACADACPTGALAPKAPGRR